MSLLDDPIAHDDLMQDRSRVFEEFLDAETELYNYRDDIARMLRLDERRLIINIDDLRDYRREFADGLLKQPVDYLPALEDALTRECYYWGISNRHNGVLYSCSRAF